VIESFQLSIINLNFCSQKRGGKIFGYFRLRNARYATAAMIATAMTAIMIAMSVLSSGCSGSIGVDGVDAGPTAIVVDAAELPYDASPANDAMIS
jgi:hypothetical protein